MHIPLFSIGAYSLSVIPCLVASLVLQPQTNVSQELPQAKFPEITDLAAGREIQAPGLSPLGATWCRPLESDLDLHFSTRGGQPLKHDDVMYAVGVFREVADRKVRVSGKDAHVDQNSLRVRIRNIVLVILDARLEERTWDQIHDALDILLLCVYTNKIASEATGTFYQIESKQRLAGVVIAQGTEPEGSGGEIAAS